MPLLVTRPVVPPSCRSHEGDIALPKRRPSEPKFLSEKRESGSIALMLGMMYHEGLSVITVGVWAMRSDGAMPARTAAAAEMFLTQATFMVMSFSKSPWEGEVAACSAAAARVTQHCVCCNGVASVSSA